MKNFSFIVFILLSSIFLNSCSYKAKSINTSSQSANADTIKKMNCSVNYFIDYRGSTLHRIVSPSSYGCSAFKYPLDYTEALNKSIKDTLKKYFSSVIQSNNIAFSDLDGHYRFVFDLEQFNPTLKFFFLNVNADTKINMKITVFDKDNKKLFRTNISGDGHVGGLGDCPNGTKAITSATEKAVQKMLDQFVYKVINTDKLKRVSGYE